MPVEAGVELPSWVQAAIAFALLLFTLGNQAVQFFKKNAAPEPVKHVVLEDAELADMRVLRELAASLRELRPVIELIAESTHILRRIDRDDAVTKEVQQQLRDARMIADMQARDRADKQ